VSEKAFVLLTSGQEWKGYRTYNNKRMEFLTELLIRKIGENPHYLAKCVYITIIKCYAIKIDLIAVNKLGI
jgi:hypothetical protein